MTTASACAISSSAVSYTHLIIVGIDKIYRQCLATLMLEVYYRFLPGTGAVSYTHLQPWRQSF